MDIYEPWAPTVGMRVRTRVSMECPVAHTDLDSVVGTVTDADRDGDFETDPDPAVQAFKGHWYTVDFDAPVYSPKERHRIVSELFAAVELTPLDDAGRDSC